MMSIDLAESHRWIVAELARARPVAESMATLIDQCEAVHAHPDWARFRKLPYAKLDPLKAWLERNFLDESSGVPLRGIWFGLFNPNDKGRTSADLYVCGSERFHASEGYKDWAVNPDWWPRTRYARSAVLDAIYRIAYGDDPKMPVDRLGINAEFPLCLGYAAFAVRALIAEVQPALILGPSQALGVAVGFDSGDDFVLIGEMSKSGLAPFSAEALAKPIPLEPVLDALRSSNAAEVFHAIFRVPHLRDLAREAVPDLIRIANTDKERMMRDAAAHILSRVAPDDPRASKRS